jgi:hypothetical protein
MGGPLVLIVRGVGVIICKSLGPKNNRRSPFDFAQGRLSAPLKYASLRMTALVVYLDC